MAVEKVYKCDLCGAQVHRDALRRLGVRTLNDRPEDADNIDVGPCCQSRPVTDVLEAAGAARELVLNG